MLYPNFLIVGMERSGTLWTSATLNEHPDIASFPNLPFKILTDERRVGEMHFFNTLASLEPKTEGKFTRPLSDYLTKYNKVFADLVPLAEHLPKEEFYKIMVERYSNFCDKQRGDKKIVGESTPAYVFHLDFIDSFYPDIKKICSIRDPKDKITSWHFSLKGRGRKTEEEITEHFALDYLSTRIVKEYEALLTYNKPLHCITYERMSREPHTTVCGLLEYLEMKVTNEIIERMVRGASFEELTRKDSKNAQTRKRGQEDQRQSLRKGIAGDWKNYLSEALAEKIDTIARPLREKVFEKYHVET